MAKHLYMGSVNGFFIVVNSIFTNYVQGSLIETATNYEFDVRVSDTETSHQVISKTNHIIIEDDEGMVYDFNDHIQMKKLMKLMPIDARTKELIYEGAPWPPQAPIATMSLSDDAQRNWIALMVVSSGLSYPYAVTTIDDNQYSFQDITELQQFCLYCLSVVSGHIASGRALKLQVNACTTLEELDAIVDNR